MSIPLDRRDACNRTLLAAVLATVVMLFTGFAATERCQELSAKARASSRASNRGSSTPFEIIKQLQPARGRRGGGAFAPHNAA